MAALTWPPSDAASGTMAVTFFHMGQGDAAVIRCPDGKVILVDCGSSEGFVPEVDFRASAYLRHFAQTQSLHALILTHPDGDHCNKVSAVLEGGMKTSFWPPGAAVSGGDYDAKQMTVERIYFSDYEYRRVRAVRGTTYDTWVAGLNRGPLVRYKVGNAGNTLYGLLGGPQQMSLVQLDGTDDHVREWVGWDVNALAKDGVNQGAERSLKGTIGEIVASGNGWCVRIIAGNVARASDDQSDLLGRNASSLVTLVEMGSWKALICGDATSSTENYLLNKRGNEIAGLNVLQVPHHGSGVTSSTVDFVSRATPKMAVVSVGLEEQDYHLPSGIVVDQWRAVTTTPSATHVVDGWQLVAPAVAQAQLEEWITLYKLDRNQVAGGYTLTPAQAAAAQAKAGDERFAVSAQPPGGWVLYRRSVTQGIFQTGLNGKDRFINAYPAGSG
jgi:beta-lactamase superfamily II metal-dependent hydrolase